MPLSRLAMLLSREHIMSMTVSLYSNRSATSPGPSPSTPSEDRSKKFASTNGFGL